MSRYLIEKEKFDPPKQHVKKISFMFVEDGKICDGCDEKRPCAMLNSFNDVIIICEECVTGILSHLNPNMARIVREDRINSLID